MPKKIAKMNLCLKVSDRFCGSLVDEDGNTAGDFDGYVPNFMPGEHYGEYVELDIDVNTGQILNWNKPTQDDLRAMLKEGDEEE